MKNYNIKMKRLNEMCVCEVGGEADVGLYLSVLEVSIRGSGRMREECLQYHQCHQLQGHTRLHSTLHLDSFPLPQRQTGTHVHEHEGHKQDHLILLKYISC
ncbi:hypothetical protein Pcinc_003295 [Petrolisthes cinctipes]|uniref:Uncharacterized protein n=1 Tax=Petrolisthes cinctipes TaxID=88211 RepID=A0AAE1L2M2_PETCI|nr:hypothetical protein Pcinc_003295 [Petrolisthes cinctipes]